MNSLTHRDSKIKQLFKTVGPGLLFASTAIGTSHLVLSTRAGAHHGMIYLAIIIVTLFVKYPLYEFGTRYANATGNSLLKAYKDQGTWAIGIFMCIIVMNMFAVTAAIAAVSAGLLSSMFGLSHIPIPVLAGVIIFVTVSLLLLGGYSGLDKFIKLISLVLLIVVVIAFIAVLIEGPLEPMDNFQPEPILKGAGLTLLISLLGWMPSGMEASTMNSIWVLEKIRSEDYQPTLNESLFDFNLGYAFTTVLAVLFLTIGSYTAFGSGQILEGNANEFSNQLLRIFTSHLGSWSYPVIAIAAFGTIYGTLIAVMDAFSRSFSRALRVMLFSTISHNKVQSKFLNRFYKICLLGTGVGGFLLFYYSASSMIQLLEIATIISFLVAPIIGYFNLKAVTSLAVPFTHRPAPSMIGLAYIGLTSMVGFALYYLQSILFN